METFRQRCVQDLAWAIRSPPLISGHIAHTDWWSATHFEQEYQTCLPELLQLNRNPAALNQALSHVKSYRLGHYFEALIAFWLEISPNYTLLAKQLPLRDENRTLGEIDFIIRDNASGRIIHLEVSVKFYLGHNNPDDMSNWHGPGLKDRLDIKFRHLCTHQTQISRKYPELVPYAIDDYACLVKGRLFYPPNHDTPSAFATAEHLHSHWYYKPPEKLTAVSQLIQLPKKDWLAALSNTQASPIYTPSLTPNRAECFAACDQHGEQQRLFIVPANFWPVTQTPDPAVEPAQ